MPASIPGWRHLRTVLPTGHTLPVEDWERRHRAMLALLWFHAIAVPVYGAFRGYTRIHGLEHVIPLLALALLGRRSRLGRRGQSLCVSLGLLTASALIVHISGGYIEAHFHFFVIIVALTLYEDWIVFLVAVAYVVLHHGTLGALDPNAVYNHPGNPWLWAAIHGAFVLAAGVAAIIAWRLNEDVRRKAGEVEERFRSAFDDAGVGMAVTSLEGTFLQVNRALCDLVGRTTPELVGARFHDITHPDDLDVDVRAARRLATGEMRHYATEKRYLHASGSVVWVAVTVSVVAGPAGPRYFIAQMQDITERKCAQEELAHRAVHDALTGLPNRLLFRDRLSVALSRLNRRPWMLGVMFVDLDRFKLVNDSLGHAAGDELLIQVAERLRGCTRGSDTLARLAGDEFTILCEDLERESDAVTLADRIAEAMRTPFTVGSHEVFVSASIGIALARPGDPADPDTLLHQADAAMYSAKDHPSSGYSLFEEGMQPPATDRLELETALRSALAQDEFVVHYQPEIDLETGRTIGMEALARWQHPTWGLVGPDRFIPTAEQTGLIVPIGAWVLREACRQLRRWNQERTESPDLRMAVNVSARQLAEPDFVRVVANALADAGVPAHQLCLEVTESAVLDRSGPALQTLGEVKRLGVRLAIDDFGSGFSSLAHIKLLPPIDEIKIDRSFVAGLGRSARDAAIVSSVISLAQSLGVTAIAEGVETEAQAAELRLLDCQLAQGFLFARPQPAASWGQPAPDLQASFSTLDQGAQIRSPRSPRRTQ